MTILDFGAEWCPSCRTLLPTFRKLKKCYADSGIDFKEIDVESDEGVDLSVKYKIRNIPVILITKDGEEKERIVGTRTYDQLKEIIDKWK